MSAKLKYVDKTSEKLAEERYENLKIFFTLSFVLSDSLVVFDLTANMVLDKPVEIYFYLRVLLAFFALYGTMIYIGGNFLIDYCDCEFTCCCGKIFNNFISICGCHAFFGGLFLITSYCIELCSLRIYYYNRDKIVDDFLVWLVYLLFFFSTITIVLFCFLLINMKTEKKIKMKYD